MKLISNDQWIIDGVQSYKRRSPNYSLTGCFRYLRKQTTLSAFGDYALIFWIAQYIKNRVNFAPRLRSVIKLSKELSSLPENEKKQLIINLSVKEVNL